MFSFDKVYHLKNDIAELMPLLLEHEEELFQVSNDKSLWTHFTENGYGEENFKTYIHAALENKRQKTQYPFVIIDRRTQKLAGITRIYAIDNALKNVKIGHTWIGTQYHGTGLNKACKYLLFDFLFEKCGIERIGFGASALNTKSIQALQGVGCIKEGELRSFLPLDSNERVNIVLMSILKTDWEDHVKEQLGCKIKAYL